MSANEKAYALKLLTEAKKELMNHWKDKVTGDSFEDWSFIVQLKLLNGLISQVTGEPMEMEDGYSQLLKPKPVIDISKYSDELKRKITKKVIQDSGTPEGASLCYDVPIEDVMAIADDMQKNHKEVFKAITKEVVKEFNSGEPFSA